MKHINLGDMSPSELPEGSWTARVDVASYMKPHPDDRRTPVSQLPLVVPERSHALVLGVPDCTRHLRHQHYTGPEMCYRHASITQTWQLVSPHPFVVVRYREHDWTGTDPFHQRGLTVARQVHRGELGKSPDLSCSTESFPSNIRDPENSSRMLRWVNLAHLARLVNMEPTAILRGFAGFSHSTRYEPNVVLLGPGGRVERFYTITLPKSFCLGESQWSDAASHLDTRPHVWFHPERYAVTQTFAHAVIRLVQFGYRPDDDPQQPYFALEAPMPEAPQVSLPVLTGEELREMHKLRANLLSELPEDNFRGAAETALGVDDDAWADTPVMSDPDGGVGKYHDNFKSMEGFDGRLVISVGFWSRAGASKSPHYYCGQLAVFPRRVDDPRRDPSAVLRLWFWPGELVRVVPMGSKGGLCPPEVPADIAPVVQRLLTQLGYSI